MAAKPTTIGLISATLGAVATAFAFVKNVVTNARDKALKSDAFKALREEYHERLDAVKQDAAIPDDQKHRALLAVEKEFTARRDEKLRTLGITQFSKAWNTIDTNQRGTSLFFAAITGVAVGSISYVIGRAFNAPSKSSGSSGYAGGDGATYYTSTADSGHYSAGHVFDGGGFGGCGEGGGGCGL